MHTKNKLGIYVYPDNIMNINGISFSVNSISYNILFKTIRKFRFIDHKYYGIYLLKFNNYA